MRQEVLNSGRQRSLRRAERRNLWTECCEHLTSSRFSLGAHSHAQGLFAIEFFGLQNKLLQIGVVNIRYLAQFHVTQILSSTFEQFGGITERSATGKPESDMIFSHQQVA